jgi:DNA invertase Pin-like site-specific DNA recombinase
MSTDVILVNEVISVHCREGNWYYFLGEYPIHIHKKDDLRSFEIMIVQLIETKLCRQVEIIRSFGISKSRVVRAKNKYKQGGIGAFFPKRQSPSPRKEGREGAVLTREKLNQAQSLLDKNYSPQEVAAELGVKYDTLRKACNDGRLKKKSPRKG